MKKISITLAFVLITFAAVTAQPRAIGLRLGSVLEASYQHGIGEKGFLQADAGFLASFRAGTMTLTYNHILFTPEWTDYGEWNFSVGGGVGGGYYWGHNYAWERELRYSWVGLTPIAQLSFKFEFPLQLAVDFRPNIGVDIAKKNVYWVDTNSRVRFHTYGLYDLALSARFCF